ncbi:DNA polymerase III subunit chi [Pseudomonas sp. KCJK9016]|uniref:DNA polymerase III subunit chi n=1 Tax=Pseudomonas sp. KCJK9016 TaxID=3344556 RepID=UPI003906338F
MDTPKPLQKPAHLLDDLESIRQLLGDDNLQPPLLTDTVDEGEQIPMLFDSIDNTPHAVEPPPAPVVKPATAPAAPVDKGPDALLHLDSELRAAAQLIMQDVIDDFAPHIETEIKRRLDARMERLLAQYE